MVLNEDFYDVAVAIADQIIERFENIKRPGTTTYKNQVTVRAYYDEKIVFNGYGSLMECNNLNLDWLDTLSIIVSDQNLSDAEVIDDDFYVLLNKNSYTIDVAGEITKHNVDFNIYRLDQRVPNYVRNKDNTATLRATIVCVMNRRKKYSNTFIKNMLYHEITHLYHMHIYGRPMTNNYLSPGPNIFNKEYFDFSEMNAYCYSFRGELDEAIKKYGTRYVFLRNTKFESKEQQYHRLAMISDKFALFKSLRNNSDLIETECLEVCKNIYMDYFSYLEEKSLIEHKQNGYFKEGYIIPRKKYYYLDYYKISD